MAFGFGFGVPHQTASVNPTLNLDFSGAGVFDPRITFTRATTATYTNSAGQIASAAIDAPRIDYDPVTLACKGLLIEEARTNLLTYSEQFDNAAWLKNAITVSANTTTAPDGTTTADKLIEANTSQYNYFYLNRTASNETVTASFYVKQDGRKYFKIQFTDNVAYVAAAVFDLNAGTVFSTSATNIEYTAITSRIESVGSGWYRVSLTVTKAAVNPYNVLSAFLVANDGSTVLYTGDGTSGLYIWGAQLEAGSMASTYIPTVASQVTRAADVAVMTGSNFSSWWNATEGSFVVEFDAASPTSTGYDRVFDVSDGTVNNTVNFIKQNGSGAFFSNVVVSGAAQASMASGVISANTNTKVSIAYKANDFAQSVNGAAIQTDTSGTVPTLNRLGIANFVGVSQLNGHIKRLNYYPTRLPNATLVALSA